VKMNDQTKLYFAIEHILHLEDLIEGNEYEPYLSQHLSTIKVEVERQLENIESRKNLNRMSTHSARSSH